MPKNMRGRLSNAHLQTTIDDTLAFLNRFNGRVEGNLATRFARRLNADTAQAAGEIRLIEDALEGRTAFGANRRVGGLAESTVHGVQTPEIVVRMEGGVDQLAEVKVIGAPEPGQVARPVTREQMRRNLGDTISQIHARDGEGAVGGLVRLDARPGGR